jgi:hypothetical protein
MVWGAGIRGIACSPSSYAPTLYYDFSDEPFVIKGKGNGVKMDRAGWGGYR